MVAQYHIIGASGRSGAALCRSLLADGISLVPVVRSAARWGATGLDGEPRLADLTDPPALRLALDGATHIVSCAHARHAQSILAASPPKARFVFLGSTRKFTRWPDDHARGVLAGEAAFVASGRPGVMLHPTMIYGAHGEDNVQRLTALLRFLPVVPLPADGRALVQPIHQDDVTRSIRAALQRAFATPHTLVIAGAEAVTYAQFVAEILLAAGLHPKPVVALPTAILRAGAWATACMPFLPRIGQDELRRLTEDKAFDIAPMKRLLGVQPRSLSAGLRNLPDWQAGHAVL